MKKRWGDICRLHYGKALRDYQLKATDSRPYRVYGTNGPIGWAAEALCPNAGIVIGRKGAYRGVHYSPDPFYVIDTAFYLELTSPEVDLLWAYYFLRTVDINRLDVGAAIPTTNRDEFYSLSVDIPPIELQRRVARQLSLFDELITKNERGITLLEEAARQLYREWFVRLRFPGAEHAQIVDGVPEGWRRMPVSEAVWVNPRTRLSDGDEHCSVEMADLSVDGMSIETWSTSTSRSGSKFQNGDTLFARITPCLENGKTGYVNFLSPGETARGSTEFIVLRSRELTPEAVYCLARTPELREHARVSMVGASGRQRVQENCFERFLVVVPPRRIADHFTDVVRPMFEQIRVLSRQNSKLRTARDLLLPRLMSGQLTV